MIRRRRDQPELEAFCRAAWPRLVGGLAVWCDSRAVAEELAQETLVRVWERWSRPAELQDPEAWMWRVAINLSRSARRRSVAERRALERVGGIRMHASEPVAPDEDLLIALRALPERQRRAVVLRHVVDLPISTVAEAMGCAEGTVRALTHQGLEHLRGSHPRPDSHPQEVAQDG